MIIIINKLLLNSVLKTQIIERNEALFESYPSHLEISFNEKGLESFVPHTLIIQIFDECSHN